MSFLRVPLFIGQLNVKWREAALFSERYGYVPALAMGPFRFTWRKWRF